MTARTCLVTGASRGIGRACAERLSADGHRVVLVSRGRAALEAVAQGLAGDALVVAADVTVGAEIERVFAEVERSWGTVDVLVANAGAGATARIADTTDEVWQQMLDLNLTAPFRCIRRALPGMLRQEWGRVVAIASVAAKRGEPQVGAYVASKHGLLGLVRAVATEVARHGVTANAVCPGYVDTPMTDSTVAAIAARTGRSEAEAADLLARRQPIGRLIAPGEVAAVVAMLVDNGGINGQGVNVDGGAVQS
ncbi:MAG: SDR family NAD(P)-dependent oxidoreductase [Nocardioidaceae bacterium]